MSEVLENGTIVLDTPEDIDFARLLALRGALKLEANYGLKLSRGVSALSIAKRSYGLRGNRAKIMAQVEQMIEDRKAARRAGL